VKTRAWAKLFCGCGLALVAILSLPGCGYHVAGKASRLPQNVHTIAVPTFRIVSDPANADATLLGSVLGTQIEPLTYDSRTGRASSGVITIRMSVTLTGSHGEVLFRNPNYLFRDEYQASEQVFSFFEEQDPAVDRLASDFARTLVSNVLEAF
jgi:outer membrane lipopolysaccharide assembly protein LptE/RlpB